MTPEEREAQVKALIRGGVRSINVAHLLPPGAFTTAQWKEAFLYLQEMAAWNKVALTVEVKCLLAHPMWRGDWLARPESYFCTECNEEVTEHAPYCIYAIPTREYLEHVLTGREFKRQFSKWTLLLEDG